MLCTSGQDSFVLTLQLPHGLIYFSIAVHVTEQKLLRQLQVTISTAYAAVLPQTHEHSLR